jgi:hypothetical protein
MVRFTRSAKTVLGKQREAAQWAGEIAAYINGNFSGANFKVFSQNFGEVGRLVWMADFENMGALEEFVDKVVADEDYWAIAAKGSDLLVEGSVVDESMNSLM